MWFPKTLSLDRCSPAIMAARKIPAPARGWVLLEVRNQSATIYGIPFMVCGRPEAHAEWEHTPQKRRNSCTFTGNHAPKARAAVFVNCPSTAVRFAVERESLATAWTVLRSAQWQNLSGWRRRRFWGSSLTQSVVQPVTPPEVALLPLPPSFPAERIVRPKGGPL